MIVNKKSADATDTELFIMVLRNSNTLFCLFYFETI